MSFLSTIKKFLKIFIKLWKYLQLADRNAALYTKLKKRFTGEFIRMIHFNISKGDRPTIQAGPVIYVCNHISYTDIPLVMNLLPDTSFIAKAEVAKWPVIGLAAKRIGTIFVQRESKSSRENTRVAVGRALQVDKKNIIVFPSGTTSINKMKNWRKGIFEIAQENQVPVVPVRISYQPLRAVAYIDDDNFVTHLFRLLRMPSIEVQIEFGAPFLVKDPIQDCAQIKNWCEARL